MRASPNLNENCIIMLVLGLIRCALAFSLSLCVVACGGGAGSAGSASPGTLPALAGAVAVGAPLSQGQVKLRQADGTVTTVPLSPSGQWTLDLSQNLSLPVVLKANGWVGGENLELYSVLTENSSHVNLTPATDTIARVVVGIGVLESYMNDGGSVPAVLTTQAINAGQAALRETLATVLLKLSLPSTVNFFTDTMKADGTGLDALYDFVKFSELASGEMMSVVAVRTIYDANWTIVDASSTSDVLSLGAEYDPTLYTQISQLVQKFLILNQDRILDFTAMRQLFHTDFLENGYVKSRYLATANYRPRTASFIDVVVTSCQTKIGGLVCDVKIGIQQGSEIRSWITKVMSTSAGLQFYGNRSGGVLPVANGGAGGIYSVPKLYLSSVVMPYDTETYITGQFKLEGNGLVDAVTAPMSIKGRGNTTWDLPKKPYAVKFNTAQSLFGLPAAKNWVLLANYLDDDLMTNVSVMQAARMMGMTFVNNMNPVELWFNGEYKGFYLLTEKVEVNPGRVDLKAGYLLELSNEYDESERWRSTRFKNRDNFGLPVMVSDRGTGAKEKDISLATIKSQFSALESAMLAYQAPFSSGDRNALSQVLDLDSAAQFLAVNLIASNLEIAHPKSVKLYKDKNKPFNLGPPWDFDRAMRSDSSSSIDFFTNTPTSFTLPFFELIRNHPDVKNRMCDAFVKFKDNIAVMNEFLDAYAYAVQDAYVRNFNTWHSNGSPSGRERSVLTYLPKVKAYYSGRVDYLIDRYNCS